ncbi:helix-turn-helix domain-containing protein [Bacillaceae bacterium W0354]
MMQLGEKLKEAREEKNLTIDDIQQETKIQKRYLISIENNDWSKIPGIFYVRAFIREYANAVGLDPEELLEEHRDELPKSDDKKYDYVTPSRKSRTGTNKVNRAIFMFIPKLLVIMLVIAVLFATYYFYINSIGPKDKEEEQNPDVITAPDNSQEEDDLTDPKEKDDEEPVEEEPVEEEPEETKQSVTLISSNEELKTPITEFELKHAEEFKIRFETNGKSYLDVKGVDSNGQELKMYYADNFEPSQSPLTIDLSSEERIRLNVGRASDLTIFINGEQLEYAVDPVAKVHQHIFIVWNKEEN